MKKIALLFLMTVTLLSCSEYNKVVNKGTVEQQYVMATEMYKAEKYSKAINLFEKITPSYRGKPQMERIQFMISNSYYHTKQYTLASYYFDRFTKNYPKSTKKEEGAYLSAHSYYLDSPVFSLDQTATHEAISAMQKYINTYPSSDKIEEANQCIIELRYKLEQKSFETAKQYYHIGDYTASITSFDILMSDYLGTSFREEAMFLKLKANYELATRSILHKKENRLKDFVKVYDKFKRNYPRSEYLKDSDKMSKNINNELSTIVTVVE